MSSSAACPGLYFEIAPNPGDASPLRSDVAAFLGRTRRGPVGTPVRVEGWREYTRVFGGLLQSSATTYAIRGYFENEGEVAYVVRLSGERRQSASVRWLVGELDQGKWTPASPTGLPVESYRIEASTPGGWANGTLVSIRYRLRGASGESEVDMVVQAPDEPVEYLMGLAPDRLEKQVAERSLLIRLAREGQEAQAAAGGTGPSRRDWRLTLSGGSEDLPSKQDYLAGIRKLGEDDRVEKETAPSMEVALVAVPGIYEDLPGELAPREVLVALLQQAEELHDRLVLIDLPTDSEDSEDAVKEANEAAEWIAALRNRVGNTLMRAAAVYHPRLKVADPLSGNTRALRTVPPSGHVAGLISRMDRLFGSHFTPANMPLLEVYDVTRTFAQAEQARFLNGGINLVRCFQSEGLVVWGGRTPQGDRTNGFIAHRRLIHRLVRVIRRVAEPLVFDRNGPELWLTLFRTVTTVLLESFRAGALMGERPEEGFRVSCDESTTPPEEQDPGRVFCDIELAPAVPMEFIRLRVALSREGTLEVLET